MKKNQKGGFKMKEITYTMQGEYQIPDLAMPEQPEVKLGVYSQMRKKYLMKHHCILYYNLLTRGILVEHLAEVEKRANEMEETLVQQMMENEGITEEMKENQSLVWIQKMTNIRSRAREIVRTEVIYN
ncbi:MAG: TnpV protein [Lachnospiraceae bacterium]